MFKIQMIINIASVITALGIIFNLVIKLLKWYLKKEKNDIDIKLIKKEQIMLTKGMLVCLKSLKNKKEKEIINKTIIEIEDYLNNQSHN